MGDSQLLITEIFHSLQGETSLSGLRFAFIRLTGCNLRCTYCDSAYAFTGGHQMTFDAIIETIRPYEVKHALITGGEPLMQRGTPELVERLRSEGYTVSIETHGEAAIDRVAGRARVILDIKTPASGMQRGGYASNVKLLHPGDEVKFVIASPSDYEWAKDLIRKLDWPAGIEILMSPAQPARGAPGSFPGAEPRWLAEKILDDRLPVRLQLQLHKILWGADRTGV